MFARAEIRAQLPVVFAIFRRSIRHPGGQPGGSICTRVAPFVSGAANGACCRRARSEAIGALNELQMNHEFPD